MKLFVENVCWYWNSSYQHNETLFWYKGFNYRWQYVMMIENMKTMFRIRVFYDYKYEKVSEYLCNVWRWWKTSQYDFSFPPIDLNLRRHSNSLRQWNKVSYEQNRNFVHEMNRVGKVTAATGLDICKVLLKFKI